MVYLVPSNVVSLENKGERQHFQRKQRPFLPTVKLTLRGRRRTERIRTPDRMNPSRKQWPKVTQDATQNALSKFWRIKPRFEKPRMKIGPDAAKTAVSEHCLRPPPPGCRPVKTCPPKITLQPRRAPDREIHETENTEYRKHGVVGQKRHSTRVCLTSENKKTGFFMKNNFRAKKGKLPEWEFW